MDKEKSHIRIPLIALRDLVVFPGTTISLYIGREHSKASVLQAMTGNRKIFLCAQLDSSVKEPQSEDLYRVGVTAEILQMLKLPDGTLKILVEAMERGRWHTIRSMPIDSSSGEILVDQEIDGGLNESEDLSETSGLKTDASVQKQFVSKKLDELAGPIASEENKDLSDESADVESAHDSSPLNQEIHNPIDSSKVYDSDLSANDNLQDVSLPYRSKIKSSNVYYLAEISTLDSLVSSGSQKLFPKLLDSFQEYATVSQDISSDFLKELLGSDDGDWVCDQIAARMPLESRERQKLLEDLDLSTRMYKTIELVLTQISLVEIEKKIQKNVQDRISKTQKDFYLGEKIKEIKKELGQEHDIHDEARGLKEALSAKGLPEAAEEKVLREIQKLEKMPPYSSEITVIRNYIDWVLDLPWKEKSEDNTNLDHAQKILEDEHYGLEKIKDRILDFIAVRNFSGNSRSPILCFVGPPGVGKTSLARSIAHSLEREFVRLSLGGVKDEAEIRGHRKTYVAAMPGRILQSLKKVKTINPVFLLDEVDKLSNDFRGDPASALLEVLDPEQNHSFQDHYLEIPYDLSQVLFIATANVLHRIPYPLRDRMEIIQLEGYTELDKLQIAKNFLLKRVISDHSLPDDSVKISYPRMLRIIRSYTKEAGVRALYREIEKVMRKAIRFMLVERPKVDKSALSKQSSRPKKRSEVIHISKAMLQEYLGKEKFRYGARGEKNEVGYCQGLAWTEMGGDLLGVEVVLSQGRGQFTVTGNLGDVMQESVKAAMTNLRSLAEEMGLDYRELRRHDVHVHIPEGAIPKDGPSAGITLATAIVSAFTRIPVKRDIAMTGEITIRGRVLPIGGLKEKVMAAHRAKIKQVILPEENAKDLDDIPASLHKRMTFTMVRDIREVLELALLESPLKGSGDDTSERKFNKNLAKLNKIGEVEKENIIQ